MKNTPIVIKALKRYLKVKGLTYKELAEAMGLSEASIKRHFSKGTISVRRLEDLCRAIGLDLWELALMVRREEDGVERFLTWEQERVLAEETRLFSFFYLLLEGWPIDKIIEKYDISENEAARFLFRLDRLKLIEMHPNNRFRLLVSKNIFWRRNGPLWNRYQTAILQDRPQGASDSMGERFLFIISHLTGDAYQAVLKKIDDFLSQYSELREMDNGSPNTDRIGAAMEIFFRPCGFPSALEPRRISRDSYP